MRKILFALFTILICFSLVVPAFAVESETPEPEATEPETSVSDSALLLDGATVNISQESVDAIANAVAATGAYTYEYQYRINFADGTYIILDTNEANLLNDHNIIIAFHVSTVYVGFDSTNFYMQDDGYFYLGKCKAKTTYKNRTLAFDTVESLSNTTLGSCQEILWANYHVYDSRNGALLYESSYVPPVHFTVSFVTGIEDFTLDSVQVRSGEAYTPPVFSYSGYEFIGCYTDPEFSNQFVAGTVISEDLTLYLKFEPIVYNYGEQLAELTDVLGVVQSQLWIILVVGLLYFVYRFFRLFF